jgi:heptosyltransferase-1
LKILIVRVSSLGDVVHNMPMVSDLRRHFPEAQIDWVVEEAYVELAGLHPDVRHVIPFALRRWRKSLYAASTRAEIAACFRQLRSVAYDWIFDTQGLFKTGALMRVARLAPGGQRIGLANATEGSGYEALSRIFHDRSVPVGVRTHGVTRSREVAARALGYALDEHAHNDLDFRLGVPQPEPVPELMSEPVPELVPDCLPAGAYAMFFHATARAAKQWRCDGWVRLADTLAQRGMQVLLPWGTPAEQSAAQALAAQMKNAVVLPAISVMEAIALIRRATVVVGVDTGFTHIAAALRRPTIELYCDSPRWKTEGFWSTRIINLGDTGAPPSIAEVEAALIELIELGATLQQTLYEESE